jgi:peptidoglycan hydrolase CwlO-like protein
MDSITPTESIIERLKKVKVEQISELRQQNREAQRQIREKDDEIVTLQQKHQDLDEKLVGLSQDLERVNNLKVENDRLRLFRNKAGS